jgi:hypothetical protein
MPGTRLLSLSEEGGTLAYCKKVLALCLRVIRLRALACKNKGGGGESKQRDRVALLGDSKVSLG